MSSGEQGGGRGRGGIGCLEECVVILVLKRTVSAGRATLVVSPILYLLEVALNLRFARFKLRSLIFSSPELPL
jgi:hypothetical protein